MSRELPDHRHRFFGREQDVAALMDRIGRQGLTALVGRPQIGKSWLLNELARRLASDEPRHLVGIAESKGETPDLLLRAIEDLYARWLEDAGARQQAKMAWDQQKKNLLPAVATAVGSIFDAAARTTREPILTIVKSGLDGLTAANRDLRTGGLTIPTLQYDQARDLLRAVHAITGTPLVLVLDQWEKSPDVRTEAKTLDSFVRAPEDWPPCHIVLGLRPDEPAAGRARELAEQRPGIAVVQGLEEMRLDEAEAQRLVRWVKSTIPSAAAERREALLGEVAGFPGVLMRWHDQRFELKSGHDLERLARDAHAYRFRELEQSLKALDGDLRRLAIRLVLLPQGGGELWPAIKDEVLADLDPAMLDDICEARILEGQNPPDFGHAKRFETAQTWLLEHRRSAARLQLEHLVFMLGEKGGQHCDEREYILQYQHALAMRLDVNDVAIAVCEAACVRSDDEATPDRLAKLSCFSMNRRPKSMHLPAHALFRLHSAAIYDGDIERSERLRHQLRTLVEWYPHDPVAIQQFALSQLLAITDAHRREDQALYRNLSKEFEGIKERCLALKPTAG